MPKLFIATLSVLAALGSMASASPWVTSATCTVTSSENFPAMGLIANAKSSESGEITTGFQLRIDTGDEVFLDKGERISDARIEIPGHGVFSDLRATGSATSNTKRASIVLGGPDLLSAAAKGRTLKVFLPTAAGEKEIEFDLAGSAVAIRHLEKCLH